MDHQDWKPVILRGNPKVIKSQKKEIREKRNPEAQRLYKLDNEDFPTNKIKTTTSEQRKAMIQGRTAKKLTQKDLANQVGINIKNIQGYENGKIQINNGEILKIEKFLKIKLTGKI
jgi:putative transcription factor